MKLTKLFGIVLSLHLGVAGMLLFQPGCQTLQKDGEPEASPEQTIISEKQQERARILIGENNEDAVVVQGGDSFNADSIRNRRYLPSRPVEPIVPETPSEVASLDIEPIEEDSLFNSTETVDLVVPDTKPLEFDMPSVETADSSDLSREVYFVQKGDSLWKISRKFGTTVEAIMEENGLSKNSILKIDQKLYLPGNASPVSSMPVTTKVESISGGKSLASGNVYAVVRGDNLSKIAKMYGVSVASLKSANGLVSDRINVGQQLTIPEGGVSGGYSAPSSYSDTSAPVSTASGSVYVVSKGDTLGKIANMYGLTTTELTRLNNLADPNRLRIGQRLTVTSNGAISAPVKKDIVVAPKSPAPKIPAPEVKPVTMEEEPLFDTDLKLDLDSSDLNDNFFEQDLDIPVVDVIKAE